MVRRTEWEAEPFSFQAPLCGTIAQFGFRRPTSFLLLRLGLKISFLIKLILRSGSGDPESSISQTAIDPDCWGALTHYAFTHSLHLSAFNH